MRSDAFAGSVPSPPSEKLGRSATALLAVLCAAFFLDALDITMIGVRGVKRGQPARRVRSSGARDYWQRAPLGAPGLKPSSSAPLHRRTRQLSLFRVGLVACLPYRWSQFSTSTPCWRPAGGCEDLRSWGSRSSVRRRWSHGN